MQEDKILISRGLVQKTIQYLGYQPYADVVQLITLWMRESGPNVSGAPSKPEGEQESAKI